MSTTQVHLNTEALARPELVNEVMQTNTTSRKPKTKKCKLQTAPDPGTTPQWSFTRLILLGLPALGSAIWEMGSGEKYEAARLHL